MENQEIALSSSRNQDKVAKISSEISSMKSGSISVLMLGAGLDVQGGITSVEKLILGNTPPEVNIHHVATFAKGSALHNIKVFLRAIAILIQSVARNEVDVVHIHFSDRGSTLRKMILAFITIGLGKPLVLHAHGAAYKEFYEGMPKLVQRSIVAIFSQCTKFISLSDSWQSYYSSVFRLAPEQGIVLQNPVVLPPTLPKRTGRKQVTFVFLGRIGKRGGALDVARSVVAMSQQDKGAFDLIRAFAALPTADRASARLVLAGNGDVEMAQQLIEELDLSNEVRVCSWLDPAERDQLLIDADAFVLPSYNEGLPMSMLEAMAWGLPVIVTPVGGIPEVITHHKNGLLVQPGNQTEITAAMQRLIDDEDFRIFLGIAARESIKPLDVTQYIHSLHEFYRSIPAVAKAPPSKFF